jgi:hypothetical protein
LVWFETEKVCSDRQELATMKDKSTSEFPNKVSDAKKVAYCIVDDDDVLLKLVTNHVLKDRAVKLNGCHEWISMTQYIISTLSIINFYAFFHHVKPSDIV